jgi:hemerythrin superfamily protein
MKKDSSSRNENETEDTRGALAKGLETIAETVGAVAGLASRTFSPAGKPDAVQMLKDDHVLVEHLFEQFEETEDNRKRAEIVRSTLDELEVHAALEEQIVYPAIRELDHEKEHQDKMDEALEEHHIVKQLMAELREMTPQDERFAPKFTVLAESVRHHVREEEGEVLPKAEESGLDLDELGRQMAERKQQLMQKANRSESKSAKSTRGSTENKRAVSGRAGAQGKRSPSRQTSGRAGATGKAAVLAVAGPAGAQGKRRPSRRTSGGAGAMANPQTRRRAAAGKVRASTRTGATSKRSGQLSGKKVRGPSKAAARSTSKARPGRARAAGRKRTRS